MARGYAPRLNKGEQHWAVLVIPALSVLLGSLTSVLPHLALYPLIPPFGSVSYTHLTLPTILRV